VFTSKYIPHLYNLEVLCMGANCRKLEYNQPTTLHYHIKKLTMKSTERDYTITRLKVNEKYQQLLLFVQQQLPLLTQPPSAQGSHQHMQWPLVPETAHKQPCLQQTGIKQKSKTIRCEHPLHSSGYGVKTGHQPSTVHLNNQIYHNGTAWLVYEGRIKVDR